MTALQVAPGVRYRHLTIDEVLRRQRDRNAQEISRFNAGVVEQLHLEPAPPRRDQVLDEFGPTARRLAR